MGESWMKWAFAEGAAKTTTRLLNKFVGAAVGSFAGSFIVPFIIGVTQLAGGFLGARLRGKALIIDPLRILAASTFGVIGASMSILSVFSFTYAGADVGITTFIVTMSIIPGAFVDWIFFRHSLSARQWAGVGAFLFAGYAMLNFPELRAFASLPPWVWLTCGIALLGAAQEGITQWQGRHKIDPLDPLVNNFWIGFAAVVYTGSMLIIFRPWSIIHGLTMLVWAAAILTGCMVLGMISFKLLAYKGGGSIALKKFIMHATYLTLATAFGRLVYAEPLTAGKFIGVGGFLIAFILMDNGTWGFVSKKLNGSSH